MWNGTVDVTKAGGDQRLDRDVRLTIADLPAAMYRIRHRRLDEQHSNINATWSRIADGRPWPDDGSWRTLIAENHLADLVPPSDVRPHGGTIDLRFRLADARRQPDRARPCLTSALASQSEDLEELVRAGLAG